MFENSLCMHMLHVYTVYINSISVQQINVCFLVDCTGSMGPWITKIKDNILIWKRRLLENYQNARLHFSFVRYTDFDQPSATRTTFLDFTE